MYFYIHIYIYTYDYANFCIKLLLRTMNGKLNNIIYKLSLSMSRLTLDFYIYELYIAHTQRNVSQQNQEKYFFISHYSTYDA